MGWTKTESRKPERPERRKKESKMELGFYPGRQEFRNMAEKGNLIPVCLEILADTETPVSVLAKVHKKGCPVFLLTRFGL